MHVDKPHIGARVSTKRRVIAGDAHADTGTVMRLEDGGYCVVKWDSDGESTSVLMMSLRPLSSDGYNEGFDDAARVARVLNSAASARVGPPAAPTEFAAGWQTCGVAPDDSRLVRMKFQTSESASDFVDRMAGLNIPVAPLAPDEALVDEILGRYLTYMPSLELHKLQLPELSRQFTAALAQARKEGAQAQLEADAKVVCGFCSNGIAVQFLNNAYRHQLQGDTPWCVCRANSIRESASKQER